MRELLIDKKNEGGRLDKFVSNYLCQASKGFIYKQLRKKNIVLNDGKATGNEILKCGDSIKIYFSESTFENLCNSAKEEIVNPVDISDYIVYEDENILVLNKPAGMLSQKAKPGDVSLNDYIKSYLDNKPETGFAAGISNRLDRNTSGIVVAGKNPAAVRELNRAIKERAINKYYWCIVKGKVFNDRHVEAYLIKDDKTNVVKVSDSASDENNTEKIITEYKPLTSNETETLLEVHLITGKSHQIRAHLAYLGHPLCGDSKYGDSDFNKFFKEKYKLQSQLLHAKKIEFCNMTGILEYLNGRQIEDCLPDTFKNILTGENLWPHGTAED